ncbi:hypothetical protein ACJMK2_035173, partial [Sinanodonta woodiana]
RYVILVYSGIRVVFASHALLVPTSKIRNRPPVSRVLVEPQPTKLDLHRKHSVLASAQQAIFFTPWAFVSPVL